MINPRDIPHLHTNLQYTDNEGICTFFSLVNTYLISFNNSII